MNSHDPQIRITVGTFSPAFDDIAFSFHVDGKAYMAILPPLFAKLLVENLSKNMGQDGTPMMLIPMLQTSSDDTDWHKVREKFVSQYWLIHDGDEKANQEIQ